MSCACCAASCSLLLFSCEALLAASVEYCPALKESSLTWLLRFVIWAFIWPMEVSRLLTLFASCALSALAAARACWDAANLLLETQPPKRSRLARTKHAEMDFIFLKLFG